MNTPPQTVLFLCSGNYYRSRFAEAVFNDGAARVQLAWRATSAGLTPGSFHGNPGPISAYTVAALAARGIHVEPSPRPPLAVTADMLERATKIIAVKEREHRPLLTALFPRYVDLVEFWNIDDVDVATPRVALPILEARVVALVKQLAER